MLGLRIGTKPFTASGGDLQRMKSSGIRCEHACSGAEALELVRLYDYDFVLMDLRLTDMSGGQVLQDIRALGRRTPVVVLADEVALPSRVRVLDEGADDVVATPCELDELLARLRAIVRRSRGYAISTLRLDAAELCLARQEVRVHGYKLHLSRREYSLLELLFLRRGTVLSRNAILTNLYGGTGEVDANAVDVVVCRLRKKLAEAGVPHLIETVWGGYILCDAGRPAAKPVPAARTWVQREPTFA
jgi:two-component system, cell cycle response regulator CtrA